jgi:DNA-directed RNA polymerase beta subunit
MHVVFFPFSYSGLRVWKKKAKTRKLHLSLLLIPLLDYYFCMTLPKDQPEPILVDADVRREQIREKAIDSLKSVFPMVGKKYTLSVSGVNVKPADYGPDEYKKALLTARTLSEPVRGTITLKNNKTGKVLQKLNNFTLMQLPYMTAHHTFLVDGNAYTVSNQLRMKPGVYTRKRRNQELEAQFNLGKGDNFRISMDPERGHFNMEYGATKIPLYPVLKKLGVSDEELQKQWNTQLVKKNQEAFGAKEDVHFNKLYQRIVRPSIQKKGETKEEAIRRVLEDTELDPEVTKKTLGKSFSRVTPETLVDASGKLLAAYNQKADFDERDSLAFKRLLGVDDFIAERIKLDARNLKRKVMLKLDYGKADLDKAIPVSPFTKGVRNFLSTSALSSNPTQINPMEIIDSAMRVTSMGEGGIPSDRAVPAEARYLHGTHLGVLDPVRTPESYRNGIDLRTSIFTARDKSGRIYTALKNKSGKTEYVPVEKAADSVIAFPGQELKGNVEVMFQGRVQSMPASKVNYMVPSVNAMYGTSSNLIPFLDSIDGNRATMGAKMQGQALPLRESEPPLIQVASYRPGKSMEQEFGRFVTPTAPVTGTVTKIKDGYIYIKPEGQFKAAAEPKKVPFFDNFPLASKTYLHDKLKVNVGDKVTEGQPLADTPYSRDGTLSLGRNLRTAYVSLRGMNSNDALVVSESAAEKMSSEHMFRNGLDVDKDMKLGRETHRTYYGNKFPNSIYEKLDKDGVVKPGMIVDPGDLLVAATQKTQLSSEAKMLGKLHKSLVKPVKDASLTWEEDTPGVVTDVVRSGNKVRVTVKTRNHLKIGDKLSGRYGNKGVISQILPDDQMIKDEQGRVIDVAISPTSVMSRINPAQVLETALAKVAEKTGKPIIVENFKERDNLQWVKDELKKHGLKDAETVLDPITGKKIKNVLVGPQYTFKLMKTTGTNYSARGVEDYDANQQPATGGITGSKSIGRMEFNSLLAHDARNVLRETAVLKSQRNDDWWRAYQLGLPAPALKPSFAYDKFGAQVVGAGIKMDKRDNFIKLGPMTDQDTLKMSAGEIKRPLFVKAKDLAPEQGGFFDPVATGGLSGTKWAHISLSEPTVNPTFERPVKTFLGLKQQAFEDLLYSEGGEGIRKRLAEIDLDAREKEVLEKLKKTNKDKRDLQVKELKYIRALKEAGLRPEDAYVVSKLPVMPPMYRPIIPGKKGDLQIADNNLLLRDAMIANEMVSKVKGMPEDVQRDARKHLYETVSAVHGITDPLSPQLKNRGVVGHLARISGAGVGPKAGFFHSKLLARRQDVSGRGTIAPSAALAMDEVGLPEDAGWSMYSPFIVKGLVRKGYKAMDAKKMVEDRHPVAKSVLDNELRERPIFVNRAPSLYRFNILAAYPKLVPGKTIRVPEALAPIQAGDFDGDAVTLTTPVTPAAVEEAKRLTLPNMLLSDQQKFTLTKAAPQQEAILGIYQATSAAPTGKKRVFKTQAEAMEAYHRGEIGLGTPVEIKK